jgi:hypothetical protein
MRKILPSSDELGKIVNEVKTKSRVIGRTECQKQIHCIACFGF